MSFALSPELQQLMRDVEAELDAIRTFEAKVAHRPKLEQLVRPELLELLNKQDASHSTEPEGTASSGLEYSEAPSSDDLVHEKHQRDPLVGDGSTDTKDVASGAGGDGAAVEQVMERVNLLLAQQEAERQELAAYLQSLGQIDPELGIQVDPNDIAFEVGTKVAFTSDVTPREPARDDQPTALQQVQGLPSSQVRESSLANFTSSEREPKPKQSEPARVSQPAQPSERAVSQIQDTSRLHSRSTAQLVSKPKRPTSIFDDDDVDESTLDEDTKRLRNERRRQRELLASLETSENDRSSARAELEAYLASLEAEQKKVEEELASVLQHKNALPLQHEPNSLAVLPSTSFVPSLASPKQVDDAPISSEAASRTVQKTQEDATVLTAATHHSAPKQDHPTPRDEADGDEDKGLEEISELDAHLARLEREGHEVRTRLYRLLREDAYGFEEEDADHGECEDGQDMDAEGALGARSHGVDPGEATVTVADAPDDNQEAENVFLTEVGGFDPSKQERYDLDKFLQSVEEKCALVSLGRTDARESDVQEEAERMLTALRLDKAIQEVEAEMRAKQVKGDSKSSQLASTASKEDPTKSSLLIPNEVLERITEMLTHEERVAIHALVEHTLAQPEEFYAPVSGDAFIEDRISRQKMDEIDLRIRQLRQDRSVVGSDVRKSRRPGIAHHSRPAAAGGGKADAISTFRTWTEFTPFQATPRQLAFDPDLKARMKKLLLDELRVHTNEAAQTAYNRLAKSSDTPSVDTSASVDGISSDLANALTHSLEQSLAEGLELEKTLQERDIPLVRPHQTLDNMLATLNVASRAYEGDDDAEDANNEAFDRESPTEVKSPSNENELDGNFKSPSADKADSSRSNDRSKSRRPKSVSLEALARRALDKIARHIPLSYVRKDVPVVANPFEVTEVDRLTHMPELDSSSTALVLKDDSKTTDASSTAPLQKEIHEVQSENLRLRERMRVAMAETEQRLRAARDRSRATTPRHAESGTPASSAAEEKQSSGSEQALAEKQPSQGDEAKRDIESNVGSDRLVAKYLSGAQARYAQLQSKLGSTTTPLLTNTMSESQLDDPGTRPSAPAQTVVETMGYVVASENERMLKQVRRRIRSVVASTLTDESEDVDETTSTTGDDQDTIPDAADEGEEQDPTKRPSADEVKRRVLEAILRSHAAKAESKQTPGYARSKQAITAKSRPNESSTATSADTKEYRGLSCVQESDDDADDLDDYFFDTNDALTDAGAETLDETDTDVEFRRTLATKTRTVLNKPLVLHSSADGNKSLSGFLESKSDYPDEKTDDDSLDTDEGRQLGWLARVSRRSGPKTDTVESEDDRNAVLEQVMSRYGGHHTSQAMVAKLDQLASELGELSHQLELETQVTDEGDEAKGPVEPLSDLEGVVSPAPLVTRGVGSSSIVPTSISSGGGGRGTRSSTSKASGPIDTISRARSDLGQRRPSSGSITIPDAGLLGSGGVAGAVEELERALLAMTPGVQSVQSQDREGHDSSNAITSTSDRAPVVLPPVRGASANRQSADNNRGSRPSSAARSLSRTDPRSGSNLNSTGSFSTRTAKR